MRPIAIAFSDLHLHEFRPYNNKDISRLEWSLKALAYICNKAIKKDVPLLFCGDLIHNPDQASNKVINLMMAIFGAFLESYRHKFIYISGNHDLDSYSLPEKRPFSWIDNLLVISDKVVCVENGFYQLNETTRVYGLPYFSDANDLVKEIQKLEPDPSFKNILLLHGDAPGAETPSGFEVGEHAMPTNLNKFFKKFDLVLMGHIHKPKQLSSKVYMLGSPIHQTLGDMGTKMGYWIVYEDLSMKFVSLNKKFPVFTDKPEHKEIDYYIENMAQAQVNEVLFKQQDTFDANQNRKKLAEEYMAIKGISNKRKLKALVKALNQAE